LFRFFRHKLLGPRWPYKGTRLMAANVMLWDTQQHTHTFSRKRSLYWTVQIEKKQQSSTQKRRYTVENSISFLSVYDETRKNHSERLGGPASTLSPKLSHSASHNKKKSRERTILLHYLISKNSRRDVIGVVAEARPTESRPHNRRHYICV
jgi:hypothetical protein